MRWAKSYSIIDHEILHGQYLHRLSHNSMVLYLFLVVVGDREGRSFYGDKTIGQILRLSVDDIRSARLELMKENLIDYRKPYFWVKNLSRQETERGVDSAGNKNEIRFSSDRRSPDKPVAIKSILGEILGKTQD